MYRKLAALLILGTSLSACGDDVVTHQATPASRYAPVPQFSKLDDIPACMALHDKLPDFYEEPPLALLADNKKATPAEATALMQCHEQGLVPQRVAFVVILTNLSPGHPAVPMAYAASFPAADQATTRVI